MNCLAPIWTECLSKTFGPLETILNWKRGNGEKRTNSDLSICNFVNLWATAVSKSCIPIIWHRWLWKKRNCGQGQCFYGKKGTIGKWKIHNTFQSWKNRGNSEKRTSSDASLQFCQFMCNAVRVSDKHQQTDSKLFVLWNTIFLCFDNLWLFDNIPMLW